MRFNQVPTAYFSMMFNIHKHISHLIFLLVPEWVEYEIGNNKYHNFEVDFSWAAKKYSSDKYYSRSTTKITNFILDDI
jgi:hypothetical protein